MRENFSLRKKCFLAQITLLPPRQQSHPLLSLHEYAPPHAIVKILNQYPYPSCCVFFGKVGKRLNTETTKIVGVVLVMFSSHFFCTTIGNSAKLNSPSLHRNNTRKQFLSSKSHLTISMSINLHCMSQHKGYEQPCNLMHRLQQVVYAQMLLRTVPPNAQVFLCPL